MVLLSAENISKSYVEKKLLNNVSFYLHENDKVGVIGVNGTGKSTFLKILAGDERSEGGTIVTASGARVGYLPQNPVFDKNINVIEQVFKGASLEERELREYEAKSILNQLGITDFEKNINLLSGGEKKRVAIASVLINPCEILILDEPTNHIDNNSIIWLEKYLQKYTGAILMVTHDRYFLDRVTNKIIEISNGDLFSYNANYSKYIELKAQREEMEIATERKNKSIYRKELEWIRRGAIARGTKSKSRIEKFEKLRDREIPDEGEKLELNSVSTRLGKKIIEINNISKQYGDKKLINNFEHIVSRDARIGIIGENGCGKSTLLKIISGNIAPDKGEIIKGETVKIGYFSQECEQMDTSLRVIDYIKETSEYIDTVDGTLSASQLLEKFLFPSDLHWNTISKLSGGERKRLFLLRIIMDAPNVLLLDEPTNDLDIQTLGILEDYLESFNGAVIVVSHDRYFLDRVVNNVWEFSDGGEVKKFLGGYSDYFEKSSDNLKPKKKNITKPKENKNSNVSKQKKVKFTFKEQYEYDKIDDVIADLEKRLEQTENSIKDEASNYIKLEQLMAEKEKLESELSKQMDRWVYLNDLADQIAKDKSKNSL